MTTPKKTTESQSNRRTLPKELRLRRSADFERVYRRRRSVSHPTLILYACENSLAHLRFGLSVSRKVGGAVARNRWKRLLREAFRLTQHDLPAGVDYIAIPRTPQPPPLTELQAIVGNLARRAVNRARQG